MGLSACSLFMPVVFGTLLLMGDESCSCLIRMRHAARTGSVALHLAISSCDPFAQLGACVAFGESCRKGVATSPKSRPSLCALVTGKVTQSVYPI